VCLTLLFMYTVLVKAMLRACTLLACLMAANGERLGNATQLLVAAQTVMNAAVDAVLATHDLGDDINSRVVDPRPTPAVTSAAGLSGLYISTNIHSRKCHELRQAKRASLAFYDRIGAGYVSLRGDAVVLSAVEAQEQWWNGWAPYFPDGRNTSYYTVIAFTPDHLEIVSYNRAHVQSDRADWLPVSLDRTEGIWRVTVPPEPEVHEPRAAPPRWHTRTDM
jgi:general stress protein 26